mgnify:FL=1
MEVVDTGLLAILGAWQVTEVDLWLMVPAIGFRSGRGPPVIISSC